MTSFKTEDKTLVYQHALKRIQKEVLTVEDAMSYLNVSRSTLSRLTSDGQLTAFKVLGCVRYHLLDLVNYTIQQRSVSYCGDIPNITCSKVQDEYKNE